MESKNGPLDKNKFKKHELTKIKEFGEGKKRL
jgi:hypothetical protein